MGAAEILDDMGREVQQRARGDGASRPSDLPAAPRGPVGWAAALRTAARATGVTTEITMAPVTRAAHPSSRGTVYFCWLDALEGADEASDCRSKSAATTTRVTFEVEEQRRGDAPSGRCGRAHGEDRIEAIGGQLTIKVAEPGHGGLLCPPAALAMSARRSRPDRG